MAVNVTGAVRLPNDTLFSNGQIIIRRSGGVVAQSSAVMLPEEWVVDTDVSGEVDFSIEPGAYTAFADTSLGRIKWAFNVAETPSSQEFEVCVEAATPTITPSLVLQAEDAADRAEAAAAALPLHVATFAGLAAIVPGDLAVGEYVAVLELGGQTYQRVSSGGHLDYSGAGGVRLDVIPSNGVLSLRSFGPAANDTTDDAAVIGAWMQACVDLKAKGYGDEGTYAVSHVRNRLIDSDLVVEWHPRAIIRGLPTNDSIAGTGANTSATATFAAGALGYGVSYFNGSTEVAWTEGVQYTVTGNTINWAAGSAPHGALAVGHTVRIWSRNPIIELGASTAFSHRCEWRGGKILNGARGYFAADASGSALGLLDFDSYHVEGLFVQGAVDYVAALAGNVTDSAIVATRCNSGAVTGCTLVGQADLGVYITGGADAGTSDDGAGHLVSGNTFRVCKQGASAKRDARGAIIASNLFDRCDVGASLYPTTSTLAGGDGTIIGNTFAKCGRPIDVRRCVGAVVTGNRLVDSGYLPDGVTPVSSPVLINMQGVTGGTVTGNILVYDELTCPTGAVGIRINADTTGTTIQSTNVKVTGNTLANVDIACREGGTGTGNVWDNDITGATTYMDVLGNRRWRYRRSNNVVEGYGTTIFEGSFTPTLAFSNSGGSWSFSRQVGRYVRRGNLVTVTCSIIGVPTHTETTATLRAVTLPFTALNVASLQQIGSVGTHNGFSYPSSGTALVCETVTNTTYVQFRATGASGAGGLVSGSQIPTGGSVRVDFTITYEAGPYADV